MTQYIAKRFVQMFLALLVLTALVFTLLHLSGNPAGLLLPANATPQQIEQMSRALGLDKPILTQYINYLGRLFRGDIGTSYRMNLPVTKVIWSYLPNTLLLGVLAVCFATMISLILGIIAAIKRDTFADFFATFVATLGQSMPTFWLAILLLLVFGVKLKWLPVSGIGGWDHYVLPVISLGWYSNALLTRVIRSNMLEVLNADYVDVARSKGLSETTVILKHALRCASLPVVTIWGLQLGALLMGSIVTETVFAWPGVGRLAVESVLGRDYPVVLGLILTYGVMFALLNVIIDISYAFLDPRISYE
jgi:peptide/nickel transport system permease protein